MKTTQYANPKCVECGSRNVEADDSGAEPKWVCFDCHTVYDEQSWFKKGLRFTNRPAVIVKCAVWVSAFREIGEAAETLELRDQEAGDPR
jgi:hypothetical protein